MMGFQKKIVGWLAGGHPGLLAFCLIVVGFLLNNWGHLLGSLAPAKPDAWASGFYVFSWLLILAHAWATKNKHLQVFGAMVLLFFIQQLTRQILA